MNTGMGTDNSKERKVDMNKLEIYVSNITSDTMDETGKYHILICDTNCWRSKRYNVEQRLNKEEYESVQAHGYYMG